MATRGMDEGDEQAERIREERMQGRQRKRTQFRALLRKNWIVRTRGAIKVASVLELLLPAVFFVLMTIPRALLADEVYNETIYPSRELSAWRWGQTCGIGWQLGAVGADSTRLGRESVKRLVCGSQYQLPEQDITQPDSNLTETVVDFAFNRDLSVIDASEATSLVEDFLRQNPQNFLLMQILCNLATLPPSDIINSLLVLENATFSRACSLECQRDSECEKSQWDRLMSGDPSLPLFPEGKGLLRTHSQEMDAVTVATRNPRQTLAVVNFDKQPETSDSLAYTIRVNGSNLESFYDDNYVGPLDAVAPSNTWANTFPLVNVQNAVESALVQYWTNSTFVAQTSVKQQPWVSYRINVGSAIAAIFLSIVVSLSFSTSSVLVLKSVVQEKELRLREAMRVMGLTDSMFWLSWFVTHWSSLGVTSFICALIGIYPFPYSDWTVTLVFLLVWSVNLIAFNYFISAFFDNSRLAATLGWFSYVLTITPSVAAHSLYFQGSAAWTWSTIVPASALHGWGQVLARLEVSQRGLTWSTFSENISPQNGYFRARDILLITTCQALVFGILAWYFDNVWPSKHGHKRHPLFVLSARYWCGNTRRYQRWRATQSPAQLSTAGNAIQQSTQDENLEPLTAEKESNASIKLKKLSKRYPGASELAVNNLSVSFAKNEVGALLGQNGAGKSTTLSILSGMLEASDGDAIVNGYSVSSDITSVRDRLGFCPQFDILWPMLTPEEHLDLFASFSGVVSELKPDRITQQLRNVGLVHKRHDQAKRLSGGQRRKLSLAVAFVGVPDVCIVDEPSSGMDCAARRLAWGIIRKQKRLTTILLTTHHLDEAEALSDRVAILSGGNVAACGSNLFLKRKFGSGYSLIVSMNSSPAYGNSFVEALLHLVRKYVPRAMLTSQAGREVKIGLPQGAASAYPALVNALECSREELGVAAYGISSSTLHDIFLNVVQGSEQDCGASANSEEQCEDEYGNQSQDTESAHAATLSSPHSDSTATLRSSSKKTADERAHDLAQSGSGNEKRRNGDIQRTSLPSQQIKRSEYVFGYNLLLQHFFSIVQKRMNIFRRDWASLVFQLLVPTLFLILALGLGEVDSAARTDFEPRTIVRTDMIPGPKPLWSGSAASSELENAVMAHHPTFEQLERAENASMLAPCACFCPTKDQVLQENVFNIERGCREAFDAVPSTCVQAEDFIINAQNLCSTTFFLNTMDSKLLERQEPLKRCHNEEHGVCDAFFLNSTGEIDNATGTYLQKRVIMPNPTAMWAVPVQVNELNGMMLSTLSTKKYKQIEATLDPLPRLSGEVGGKQDINIPLLVSILVALGASVLAASYSIHLAWERSTNAKHLQMVSGINVNMYWIANLVVDHCTYLLPLVVFISIFAAFQSRLYSSTRTLEAIAVLFALFGWAIIPAVYSLHFFFTTEMNAFVGQLATFGFFSFGLLLSGAILENLQNEDDDARATWKVLQWLWKLLPQFCLGKGLFDIALNTLRGSTVIVIAGQPQVLGAQDPFTADIAGDEMGFLAMEGLIFFFITLGVEHWPSLRYSNALSWLTSDKSPYDTRTDVEGREDVSVRREKERVQNEFEGWMIQNSLSDKANDKGDREHLDCEEARGNDLRLNDILILNALRKVYPNGNAAVCNISVGVQQSELFGLLGTNGAGKSTTFKMLTSEEIPTSGDAYVRSRAGTKLLSVTAQRQQARQLMGYCPQYDALNTLLTVREHLHFYARIRGAPHHRVDGVANALIWRMHLSPFADRKAGNLSGGNKRKLCVAISLICEPEVVLLDEMSTGVDAGVRRFLWDVVLEALPGRVVVLTTHSMDECEALCTKLGIMARGSFRCFGSVTELKERYGEGYFLTVKVPQEHEERMRSFVLRTMLERRDISHAALIDKHEGKMVFKLNIAAAELSGVFGALERLKNAEGGVAITLNDYAVEQDSLERIFVSVAENAALEEEREDGRTKQQNPNEGG